MKFYRLPLTFSPAAYDTILMHLNDLNLKVNDYDLIVTGDLGYVGGDILIDLFARRGIDISPRYNDCGRLIFDRKGQDVHAGGSGCGCCGSVLCGYLLKEMQNGTFGRILVCATGAMLSTTTTQQGLTIPGICYAVSIDGRH